MRRWPVAEAPLWDQETEPWGLVMTCLAGCVGGTGLVDKAEGAELSCILQSESFGPLTLGLS